MKNNIKTYWPNFIGGKFVDGECKNILVENPATCEVIAEQACASDNDVAMAVQAARDAADSGHWSNLRPIERGRKVKAIGDYLLDNIDEISTVLTLEAGKPLWESKLEIEGAARYFEYYGNQAETIEGRSVPLGKDYFDFTVCEPYGVSAQIVPWNYPVEMLSRSLSAALATGNSCVVKTPELDPLACFYIAEASEAAGIPPGVVNIICGYGNEAGASLIANNQINQAVFTGSVQTGISVATAAAANVVPCVLELGGKSAAIVMDDADLDKFMDDVRWGIFFNAGQVCSAMSRVVVHESIHDELASRIVELAQKLSVGPGIERDTFGANMGAMISQLQRDKAVAMVARAHKDGATILTGGGNLKDTGCFMEPTVITNAKINSEIAQQEVFGPVITLQSFETDDEAIKLANSTQYGLVGGIFTKNINKAARLARQMRAGQIFINEWFAGGVETPFGGFGKSGYGREKGREALWNYVQTKNIAIRIHD